MQLFKMGIIIMKLLWALLGIFPTKSGKVLLTQLQKYR